MAPKVIILMADYGHDPTEVSIPWKVFEGAGFECHFATENGKQPICDGKMLSGMTATLLGANQAAKGAYSVMSSTSDAFKNPSSWTDSSFNLSGYDLVFLPGGHDKGVQQIIDSKRVHELLASYFPLTKKPSKKTIAAICHGVQVLAASSASDADPNAENKSILYDVETTALPAYMEQSIFQATRLFLGDYYKTYGAGTDSVQEIVSKRLKSRNQFVNSYNMVSPFVVADSNHNYLSARYPPDAQLLAEKSVAVVTEVTSAITA